MSRGYAFAGVCLAGICGVLGTYSTFRPELEKQRAERLGQEYQEVDDKAISRAISNDLYEAKEQLKPKATKGFAWGIREAIWGKPEDQASMKTTTVHVPVRTAQDMAKSPQESIDGAKVEHEKG